MLSALNRYSRFLNCQHFILKHFRIHSSNTHSAYGLAETQCDRG